MSNEPMFNIPEQGPVKLAGFLFAIQLLMAFGPHVIRQTLQSWAVLVPMEFQSLPPIRQGASLLLSGVVHPSWMDTLVVAGMTMAFGVVTVRGIRAKQDNIEAPGKNISISPDVIFAFIFFAGVVCGGLFQWGWWSATKTVEAYAVGGMGGISALFATMAWRWAAKKS